MYIYSSLTTKLKSPKHYIMHEIERTLKEHVPVENYVVVDGEIIAVSEKVIDLSKSHEKLTKMI